MSGTVLLVVFAIVVLALGIRLLAGLVDKDRIRSYVAQRGGRVVDIRWAPFGRGWFGEKNDRIYEVEYKDAEGTLHLATCKTSLWSGVYWTEDRSVRAISPPNDTADENARLREENARLSAELDRLRKNESGL